MVPISVARTPTTLRHFRTSLQSENTTLKHVLSFLKRSERGRLLGFGWTDRSVRKLKGPIGKVGWPFSYVLYASSSLTHVGLQLDYRIFLAIFDPFGWVQGLVGRDE